jgi:hypothetical protein
MIPEYQKRVVDELKELEEKTAKLADFIACPAYQGVVLMDAILLNKQLAVMRNYCFVLRRRIDRF